MNEDIIQPPKMRKNVTLSVEKTLSQWAADNPRQQFSQTKELWVSKEAVVKQLSEPFKKVIPIMLIFGAVMIIALIMGNMPTVVSSIGNTFGVEKHIVTETIQKVEIVYLTPEEALAQGIAIPTIVPPDTEPAPTVNQVPEDVTIKPGEETNPRLEGFDVLGNLMPSIPVRVGDDTVVVGSENQTSP